MSMFIRHLSVAFGLLCLAGLAAARPADPLTIGEAVSLATEAEPGVLAARQQSLALREHAIAANALPDPQARLGLLNLPIDTFAFDQEPMTQAQLGLRQAFPPAGQRDARAARFAATAAASDESAVLRQREVALAARSAWLESHYWGAVGAILNENRRVFSDLLEVTRALYGQGHKSQHDVIRAELELSRVEDRLAETAEKAGVARAALAQWVGADNAARPIAEAWPAWPAPRRADLLAAVAEHPSLRAAADRIDAAAADVDEARAAFRPSWALDLGYGFRGGVDAVGKPRSDMMSIMINVDLPLFTGNRQDRQLAASRHERFASELERERLQRELVQEIRAEYARWENLGERAALYDDTILKQAAQQVEAALAAYRNERADFADVMRAAVTQLELRLARERLRTDRAKSRARLEFLGGNDNA